RPAYSGRPEQSPAVGEARQQRPGLDPGLLDLRGRVGVPDDAAPDPEVDAPIGDREGADRQPQLEVAVRVDPAERCHRRAATDQPSPCMAIACSAPSGASAASTPLASPRNGALWCATTLTW